MNARQIKALAWVGALGLGGWLGWTIYEFVEERQVLQQGVSEEAQVAVLNDVVAPPPPKDDSVPYELVRQAFDEMNWPGTPPKVVEAPTKDLEPVGHPIDVVRQCLHQGVDVRAQLDIGCLVEAFFKCNTTFAKWSCRRPV